MKASGSFEIEIHPQGEADQAPGSTLGRMTLAKTFKGDLVGSAAGEMLTAMTDVEGSAGYVAIERVTGLLHQRAGTFVLQHHGSMSAGTQELVINVVPDSGTGDLRGISGTFSIRITDGAHFYDFDYTLPDAGGSAPAA